jgi:hypothetical protein
MKSIAGVRGNDLNLAATGVYGLTLGSAGADARWFGGEAERYLAHPNVEQQRVTGVVSNVTVSGMMRGQDLTPTVSAFNLLLRYPDAQWDPYAGGGLALGTATRSDGPMRSVSTRPPGLHRRASLRTHGTSSLSVFTGLKDTACPCRSSTSGGKAQESRARWPCLPSSSAAAGMAQARRSGEPSW